MHIFPAVILTATKEIEDLNKMFDAQRVQFTQRLQWFLDPQGDTANRETLKLKESTTEAAHTSPNSKS
jgi:hypothetical protein